MSIKEDYRRARQNLLRRVKSWQKKGYELLTEIPTIPKKVTRQSVQRLQKIQLQDLVKRGKIVSRETGEIFTPYGFEVEQAERRKSTRVRRRQIEKAERNQRKKESQREREREAERMAEEYHKREQTIVERSLSQEEQVSAEFEDLEREMASTNQSMMLEKFRQARQQLGDARLSELVDNEEAGTSGNNLARSLQVSVGMVQYYEAQGRYDKANSIAELVINTLNDALALPPLSAEEMQQLAMTNYAE